MIYLDFKQAKCKDCFKCLRECPVKAIKFENNQAKIIEDRCILCGKCTTVCPQNAKKVHSEIDDVIDLLHGESKIAVSLAPSFVSSFEVSHFETMDAGLQMLGFDFVEETAVGARIVTDAYQKLLQSGQFENLISSACPAVNTMIQNFCSDAVKFLAPIVSPMIAHAKILKKRFPDHKIVFVGPCIAKKKEAKESGLIDAVLTFEELTALFESNHIELKMLEQEVEIEKNENNVVNTAKFYPISTGIIKSFSACPENYEYVAVDGVKKCFEVLKGIDKISGMFLEMSCCEHSCVGGPCSMKDVCGALKANSDIRKYVACSESSVIENGVNLDVDLCQEHPKVEKLGFMPTEREIKEVLSKTGKYTVEDELNCGACGYSTCREKAIAVLNGCADIEMCIPYMRKRAESMSYEIIQNSPNGIVVIDNDYKILEINQNAEQMLGVNVTDAKGMYAFDCFDSSAFISAYVDGKNVVKRKIFVTKSQKHIELSIVLLKEHKIMFGVMKDITKNIVANDELQKMKISTLLTTDEVIKKQMRVAQEIASLLGETTAETKVALLKLKATLQQNEEGDDE